MTDILRMSELYVPTLKEDPADAEIASHRLLLRAGMIRKTASGVYTFLPLGYRVLSKVEKIIREEMNAIGAQEIMMPALQPAELWHESGRWNDYGPELMRLHDRHDRQFCLGPTHEELITALVRNELRSYKQLPLSLYQIQVKFRDEIRPRFGLLRSREFIMKDAYSFNETQESLQKTYDDMGRAYGNMCDRFDLDWRAVAADSGQIGGNTSVEYMALAEAGEAELVYCECDYAANTEASEGAAHPVEYDKAQAIEKIATPNVHTIAELATFLDIEEAATVKALSAKDSSGAVTVFFVPGDHDLNEIKAGRLLDEFEILTDEDMEKAGLVKGCMGPVGLPEGVRTVADVSLKSIKRWVVGANEEGYHYVGAGLDDDFTIDAWEDLVVVREGDSCPKCGKALSSARGIEVSQIFQFGDKYSKSMNAVFSAEDGTDQPFFMGSYGVGVTRCVAAIVEQHNDEFGIAWPFSIAPAHVCIVPLTVGDDEVQPAAEKIATELSQLGVEVVIDDRDERPGVKFAEADLLGWPMQIIVGKRGLKDSKVEIKNRKTGEKIDVSLDALSEMSSFASRNVKQGIITKNLFDSLF